MLPKLAHKYIPKSVLIHYGNNIIEMREQPTNYGTNKQLYQFFELTICFFYSRASQPEPLGISFLMRDIIFG